MRSAELRRVFRHVLSLSLVPVPAVAIALGACGGGVVEINGDGGSPGDGGRGGDGGGGDGGGTSDGGVVKDGGSAGCNAPNFPMWNKPGCGRAADLCMSPDTPQPACYSLVCGCSGKVIAGCTAYTEAFTPLAGNPGSYAVGGPCTLPADAGCVTTPVPPPPDAGMNCASWTTPLPCDFPDDAGAFPSAECQKYCGTTAYLCYKENESTLRCDPGCAIGRRPEGFTPLSSQREGCEAEIGGLYFAAMAELEAASVGSFERLELELLAHGAPASLRARARRAAADERRHARVAAALAERFGGSLVPVADAPQTVRSLEAMAMENAVEGCVRETFGALTATLQAERAGDRRVRAAMRRIATDETAHAGLAWAVAAWLETRLDDAAKARVRAAAAAAVDELAREVTMEQPAVLRSVAGLPAADEATRMVAAMRESLWAA